MEATPTVPGKERPWGELSGAEQEAALRLGWTEDGWHDGARRPMAGLLWAADGEENGSHTNMTAEQIAAAELLGHTPVTWNQGAAQAVDAMDGTPEPIAEPVSRDRGTHRRGNGGNGESRGNRVGYGCGSILVALVGTLPMIVFSIIILARTNALVDSKDCLQIGEEVCDRATASFGIPSRPGFVKVDGVFVFATTETCYAAVSQPWEHLISGTRAWGDLLLVVNVIATTAVLCVGYRATFAVSCGDQYGITRLSAVKSLRNPSQPSGVMEACLVLGVIFLFPAGVVHLVMLQDKSAKLVKACEDSPDLAMIRSLIFVGGALLFVQCCVFVPAFALFHKLSRQALLRFVPRSKRGRNAPQP